MRSPCPALSRAIGAKTLVVSVVIGGLLTFGAAPVAGSTAPVDEGIRVAARSAYAPVAGPIFAPPGTDRVHQQILQNIANTPPGAKIRAATWSFSDPRVAYALEAAHNRGVAVRLVVSKMEGDCDYGGPVAYLRPRLTGRSELTCRKSRTNKGAMHSKVWAFSTVGSRKMVTLVTSANVTDEARDNQWTDAYQAVGWSQLYVAWGTFFDERLEKRRNKNEARPFQSWRWGNSSAYALPATPGKADPVYSRLSRMPARGLRLRLANAAMFGPRGQSIASLLVKKKQAGANIAVALSKTNSVAAQLRGAGIPVKIVDRGSDSSRQYLHHKFISASYLSGGKRVYRTLTGSENLTTSSFASDEFMVGLASRKTQQAYARYFKSLPSY